MGDGGVTTVRVRHLAAVLGATTAVALCAPAHAQDAPPAPAPTPAAPAPAPPAGGSGAPTRDDFDKLKKQLDELNAKFEAKKTEDAEKISDLEKKQSSTFDLADALRWGTTRFLLAGTAHADFSYNDPARNVTARSSSVFGAGLELDTLWKVSDFIFFEGGADFEITGQAPGATSVSLAICDVNFTVNDYMVLRAGLMPTAFSRYKETLDAVWINKMPDQPLIVGLVPDTTVGVEARGALPVGPIKLLYAAYCMNDPVLNRSATDPTQNGTLNFYNFAGFDDIPMFGSKLGFLLMPELEVGGAVLWSKVGQRGTGTAATDTRRTDVFEFDLYARFNKKTAAGTIDFQAEWVFQHIRRTTYNGSIAGQGVDANGNPITTQTPFSLRFTNERQSGYVQVGYRLSNSDNEYLKNLELLVRGDWLGLPKRAPVGFNNDTYRLEAGADYWFTPSIVLKVAYEYTSIYAHTSLEAGPPKGHDTEAHGVTAQVAMGF